MGHTPFLFVEQKRNKVSEDILVKTFTESRSKLMRIVRRFFPNGDEADDALQEAFCRLWTRADCLRTSKEAEAMAATTVRNLCVDTLRHRKRVEEVELGECDMSVPPGESDGLSEREEMFRMVEQIVESRLTPLQKQIFHMKEYEGLSFSVIAETLGMQQPAVRMQLSRARKEIRMCYRKQNGYGK